MKDKAKAKKVVSSDNTEIYYWTSWNSEMDKDFLVLHPGASMNHSSLQGLEKGINDMGHPTVIFDQRGTGYSEVGSESDSHLLDRYTEDLQRIIEQEGLEKPGIITHSFGFMPAINYASKSNNVGKITGICASPNFSKTSNPFLFKLFTNTFMYCEYLGCAGTYLLHTLTGNKRGYSEQNLAGASDFRIALSIYDNPLQEIRAHIAKGKQLWDISEQLKSITNPLQLIYGKNDLMVRPYAGEEIEKLVKGKCNINIVEGTHTLPITHPERVLEVISCAK